ncbi:MAG: hypothetical protein V4726_12920 [Verrucomicrobiota bacterium]
MAPPISKPYFWNGNLYTTTNISTDLGRTWQDKASPRVPEATDGGYYLAPGGTNSVWAASYGSDWKSIPTGSGGARSLAFGNNAFVGVGKAGGVIIGTVETPPPVVVVPELRIFLKPIPVIKWQSVTGFTYQLQTSGNLRSWSTYNDPSGGWSPGDGNEMTMNISVSGKLQYFRLAVKVRPSASD